MNTDIGQGHSSGTDNAVQSPAVTSKEKAPLDRDDSYRWILGDSAWRRLKPEVRKRFSQKPRLGKTVRYTGVMHTVDLSWMGWLFAQCCRLIGTPLAPYRGEEIAMRIELTPDEKLHGIAWHREYDFPNRENFTVRSTKCAHREGEFIEHIGCGFQMRLEVSERNGGIQFRSTAYEISLLNRKIRIPSWLTPGVTTVVHEQIAGEQFRFSLAVDHPLLGRTIFQDGEFQSAVSD